jgi:hypothetical protein
MTLCPKSRFIAETPRKSVTILHHSLLYFTLKKYLIIRHFFCGDGLTRSLCSELGHHYILQMSFSYKFDKNFH